MSEYALPVYGLVEKWSSDFTRFHSYDLETHAIAPGLLAPPIVIGSTASFDSGSSRILDASEALDVAEQLLRSDAVLVTANGAFDFGCLCATDFDRFIGLVFAKYERGEVIDVQVTQALHAIADGSLFREPSTGRPLVSPTGKQTNRYSLDTCNRLVRGRTDAKVNDMWRVRYAMLAHVPRADWPAEAKQYPLDDADNTVNVAVEQVRKGYRNMHDLPAQVETAWCMHLGAMWGIRTCPERVAELSARVEREQAVLDARRREHGFVKSDGHDDTRAIKAAVARAYGATRACEACAGKGRARKLKGEPCRGPKVKGRYAGCYFLGRTVDANTCTTCNNTGVVEKLGNEVTCEQCDGSGMNLDDAPTLPRTEKGGVKTDRDTLVESDDPVLVSIADNEVDKVAQTYLPFLREGTERPINLRPNVLVESGRTSYDGLIQLIPRTWGVRSCFKARPGYLFGSVDYSALELCTLAQCCLWVCGASRMADTINASKDPGSLHAAMGALMMGVSLDEFKARLKAGDKLAKAYRQAAKAANFGFPGGMGAARLVIAKRKRSEGSTTSPNGKVYPGIRFCILLGGASECGLEKVTTWKRTTGLPPTCKHCIEVVEQVLRPAYFESWPEMNEYFDWIKHVVQSGEIECFVSQRVRGDVSFCSGANNQFQALAADGAKNALRRVSRECYLDKSSALYGTRPIMFVHDEIFAEHPTARASDACVRMSEVMVSAMREYVPDVHVKAEPTLMQYWYKDAEPVWVEGKLVPWSPKEERS